MPTGGVDVLAGSFLADAVGTEAAAALGSAALGGEIGAGIGGLEGLAEHKNPLTGALKGGIGGALTGGAIGFGPELGGSLGIGIDAGDVLAGAGGGALGAGITGGNPITGALEGGLAGGVSSQFGSQTPGSTAAPSTGGGPGLSAGGIAAPAGADLPVPASDLNLSGGTNVSSGLPGSTDLSNIGNNLGASSSGNPLETGGNLNLGNSTDSAGGVSSGGGAASGNAGTASIVPGATGTGTNLGDVASQVNPGGSSSGSLFSKVLGPNASPLGVGLSGAGLAANVIQGQQAVKGEKQLEQEAGRADAQGQQLESYLQNGTLPPGLQAGVTQASNAAKATIRSRYASMGMSGSSAEQQELAQVDSNAQAQGAQMAMQLLQTGIAESGTASQLYEAIMNSTLAEEKGLGSSIANFASAAAGASPQTGKLIQIQ